MPGKKVGVGYLNILKVVIGVEVAVAEHHDLFPSVRLGKKGFSPIRSYDDLD